MVDLTRYISGTVSTNWLATTLPWLYISGAMSEAVTDSALMRYFSHVLANLSARLPMDRILACDTPSELRPGVNHADVTDCVRSALPYSTTTGDSGFWNTSRTHVQVSPVATYGGVMSTYPVYSIDTELVA